MEANAISQTGLKGRQTRRGAAPRGKTGRLAYGVVAALLLAFLAFEAIKYGWGAVALILVFMAAPDLALIGGFRSDLDPGQLAPGNVPIYNLLHTYWLAAAFVAFSFLPWPELWLGQSGLEFFLVGLTLAAHITLDRAFGFGLRTRDGYQR